MLSRFLRRLQSPSVPDVAPNMPAATAPVDRHALLMQIKEHAQNLDENERYILAEQAATAVYPHYKFSEFGRVWLHDKAFFADYERFMDPNNWHSADRKFALNSFATAAARLPGDFAECGVYNGASAILMGRAASAAGKHVHLFDSYEGLSEPGDNDGHYWTKGALSYQREKVENNLAEISGSFTCYEGWIPSRFEEVSDQKFAFLHVDVDLYEPTRDSIAFFYPRMTPGGFMLLDDHGFESCVGARQAATEFFSDKPEALIDLPTGQGLVVRR